MRDSKKPKGARSIIAMLLIIILALLSSYFMSQDQEKININTSSVEALESLPDIGKTLAERIVQNRPYNDVWSLNRVKGIGPATIEAIENKVVTK